jgi:hypothetical protein
MASFGGFDCAWVDFIVFPAFVDYTGIEKIPGNQVAMSISPNPANEKLTIKAKLAEKGIYRLNIYDNEGRVVMTTDEVMSEPDGSARQVVDVSALKPGYYSCRIISGKLNITRPFIVN